MLTTIPKYAEKKNKIGTHDLWTITFISKQGSIEVMEVEEENVDKKITVLLSTGIQAFDITIFPPSTSITYKQFKEMRKAQQ